MKNLSIVFLILLFALGCRKSPTTDPNDKLVVTEWIKNLETPWQITHAPDGRIFFTERGGRVRVVKNGILSTWLDLTQITH